MKKVIVMAAAAALCALVSVGCGDGGSKEAVALNSTYVFKLPGTNKAVWKPERNYTAFIKRGESLTILKKHKDMDSWYRVQLSGGETRGWLHSKNIFIGKKAPVTFTKGGKSYSRPDEASPSSTIKQGQTGLIIKRLKNGWVKVNLAYKGKKYFYKGGDVWVQEDAFERGVVEIKPEDVKEKIVTGAGTAEVSASSVLKEGGGYSYDAKNAFDGNMATTWQEGKPGSGIGEWIEVKYAEGKMVDISMVNGFNHSDGKYGDLYDANCRVKRVRISYGADLEKSVTADLMDGIKDFQKIASGIFSTRFRITLLEVYKGTKWQDTAISEIRITPFESNRGGGPEGTS